MASHDLFTREEVLGGLPARRAHALLYQIEGATARAARRTGRVASLIGIAETNPPTVASLSGEDLPRDSDAAWYQTFDRRRGDRPPPSVQQIERCARDWGYLAPKTARLQAALAHLMGQKYRFTRGAVPGIRSALQWDTAEVRQAYRDLYGAPLESIYAQEVSLPERLRWSLAALGKRLDALPPFWMAFAFILIGHFPEAVLVLPIVAAGVGPRVGLALLAVIGAANLLTITFLAEAVARSGSIQYRNAFLGRLTANYLGRAGSHLVYNTAALQAFLVLLAGFVGISLSLSHSVGLPPPLWGLLFAAFLLYRLWRGERASSVSVDLLLGGVGVGFIVLLSLVALTRAHLGYLGSRPADLAVSGAVFGGLLMCYYGHTGVPQLAKLVLPRDPSGHSLIRGCVAGTVGAMLLHAVWLLAISAAISPTALAGHAETALQPLGDLLGPVVAALGVATLCVFIGLDGAGASDMLFNLVRERLPVSSHSMGMLARQQDRLLFSRRDHLGEHRPIGLVYLGLVGGHPRFRVDVQTGYSVKRVEIALAERWEIEELFGEFPDLRKAGYRLSLELVEAGADSARFLITTPLQITHEGGRGASGLSVVQTLDLSERERQLLHWLMAHGEAGVAEAAAENAVEESAARAMFAALEQQRLVERVGDEMSLRYRPRWTRRRRSRLPDAIWQNLAGTGGEAPAKAPAVRKRRADLLRDRAREIALSERGRFVLAASPVLLAGLASPVLLRMAEVSFAGILEVCGVLTIILSAGIFPVLLLASCRRKGVFVPPHRWSFLGHPGLLAVVYALFLTLLVLHGFVFWHHPIERAGALIVATLALGATVAMARRGAFTPRMVIELREDLRQGVPSAFRVVSTGQHTHAQVRLAHADGEQVVEAATGEIASFELLTSIQFCLPTTRAKELKVWAHRVTPEGDSESLPALVEVRGGDGVRHFDLSLLGGQVLIPMTAEAYTVEITPVALHGEE
jgi:hypothetical protein